FVTFIRSVVQANQCNPKPNNLDRRFRIYRETLSRFSCAASLGVHHFQILIYYKHRYLKLRN
ncbi:hypothetical protein ACTMNS_12215, partial [Staphylococcus haemolyticus]